MPPPVIHCAKCRRPMRLVAIWVPTGVPRPIVGYACKCGGYAEVDQYEKIVHGPKLKLDLGASPVHRAIWMELQLFGKYG